MILPQRPLGWLALLALVAVAALAGWLYSRPDMAIFLAEQLWACF